MFNFSVLVFIGVLLDLDSVNWTMLEAIGTVGAVVFTLVLTVSRWYWIWRNRPILKLSTEIFDYEYNKKSGRAFNLCIKNVFFCFVK